MLVHVKTKHVQKTYNRLVRDILLQGGSVMDFMDLTPELREKAKACKSAEELVQLAKEEGLELSDDDLNAISGGKSWKCMCEGIDHCPAYDPDSAS